MRCSVLYRLIIHLEFSVWGLCLHCGDVCVCTVWARSGSTRGVWGRLCPHTMAMLAWEFSSGCGGGRWLGGDGLKKLGRLHERGVGALHGVWGHLWQHKRGVGTLVSSLWSVD